jgi:hypothetical protein
LLTLYQLFLNLCYSIDLLQHQPIWLIPAIVDHTKS